MSQNLFGSCFLKLFYEKKENRENGKNTFDSHFFCSIIKNIKNTENTKFR